MRIPRPLLLLLLVISIIFSCAKNDTRISSFEKIMGEPESTYLNEIIKDFDAYLKIRYKEYTIIQTVQNIFSRGYC